MFIIWQWIYGKFHKSHKLLLLSSSSYVFYFSVWRSNGGRLDIHLSWCRCVEEQRNTLICSKSYFIWRLENMVVVNPTWKYCAKRTCLQNQVYSDQLQYMNHQPYQCTDGMRWYSMSTEFSSNVKLHSMLLVLHLTVHLNFADIFKHMFSSLTRALY